MSRALEDQALLTPQRTSCGGWATPGPSAFLDTGTLSAVTLPLRHALIWKERAETQSLVCHQWPVFHATVQEALPFDH